jgi:glutaredoxin
MKQHVKKWTLNIILTAATAALALAIGSQLPAWLKKPRDPYKNGDYSAHIVQLPHKITLYGTTTCPYCKKARDYLKQAGIPFNDQIIDESKTAEAAFKQLGEKYVPVLVSEKNWSWDSIKKHMQIWANSSMRNEYF